MSENSDRYRLAISGFSALVDAFPDGQWSAPAPCEGWTARHVLSHVINGTRMISVLDTGTAPDYSDPLAAAGDDPAGNFAKARDLAVAALTDQNLAAAIQSPMGEMPLDQMIGMFMTSDVLIHTWDLSKAAGNPATLDPGLVDLTYNALLPLDAMIRMPNVFGPKVEPPPGADMQTKLICFSGRTP